MQKALGDKEQSTAINEVIKIIQELASKAFSISVSELSELITRDSTITAKVISAANTLGFNPSGSTVSTVTEAIHTIGFEKVRNLSISILLVENAGQSLNADEQREIAAMALASGLMAQQLIEQMDSSVDPELAFVCSSLRNYGKLLMSTFLLEDYRLAKSTADNDNEDEAFKKVFGLTPLELGQILLKSSNLPPSIMNSLKSVPARVLEKAADNENDEILVIADFCLKVCNTTFNENIPPENFNSELEKVIGKFNKSIPVSLDMVNMSLSHIDTNISMFARAIGHRSGPSPFTEKIKCRVAGKPLPQPPKRPKEEQAKSNQTTPTQQSKKPTPPPSKTAAPDAQFNEALDLLTRARKPGEVIYFKEIYEALCQSIQESLSLESCTVFINEIDEKALYSGRYGTGPLIRKIRNRALVSSKKRDVFGICILKQEDILIQDATAGKIKSVIPDWLDLYSETQSFVLLPIVRQKNVFSIILGTSRLKKSIVLDKTTLSNLRKMRAGLTSLMDSIEKGEFKMG